MSHWIGIILLWLAALTYFLLGDKGLMIVGLLHLIGLTLLFVVYAKYNRKE